jgi:hypothetical protein
MQYCRLQSRNVRPTPQHACDFCLAPEMPAALRIPALCRALRPASMLSGGRSPDVAEIHSTASSELHSPLHCVRRACKLCALPHEADVALPAHVTDVVQRHHLASCHKVLQGSSSSSSSSCDGIRTGYVTACM